MKFNRKAVAALAVVGAAAIAVTTLSPASAATRSTVVIVQSNALTSLNPSTPDTNLTFNVDVAYLSGIGFNYYNSEPALVKNTTFGSYKIVSQDPFKVQYRVAPGRVWSDGTPITGVDLLLSHVLSSSKYSVAAGLGDPTDSKAAPAFNSGGYGGTYDEHIVGEPKLDANRMSITITYDSQIPDWEISGPGPSPVHTLVALANGEKKLGTSAHNVALKNKFLTAFTSKDTDSLKKMGKIWSEAYNITQVDAKTNPLLLVGNGPYLVSSAVTNGAVTMKLNTKYNSGPKTSGIDTVVFKVIGDGTAAAQALANKEIDVYAGQPTADSVAQLKAIPGVDVVGFSQAVYEHVDLRVGPAAGSKTGYTGPFAGMSQKAVDLRTAFLLAYPRAEIIEKIVKPINSKSVLMNSLLTFPAESNYASVIANNGSSKYSAGTQAERTAKALALVKKYFPDAAAGSGSVKVKLLWGQPSNARRAAEAALVKAELAKAGFDVTTTGTTGWSSFLDDNTFDAQFFAWVKSAITQKGNTDLFCSDCSNNHLGYENKKLDAIVKDLGATLLPKATVNAKYLEVENMLMDDAVSLPIFQHPGVAGVNSALKGVDPSPLSPNLVWNIWDWKF